MVFFLPDLFLDPIPRFWHLGKGIIVEGWAGIANAAWAAWFRLPWHQCYDEIYHCRADLSHLSSVLWEWWVIIRNSCTNLILKYSFICILLSILLSTFCRQLLLVFFPLSPAELTSWLPLFRFCCLFLLLKIYWMSSKWYFSMLLALCWGLPQILSGRHISEAGEQCQLCLGLKIVLHVLAPIWEI